VLSGCWRAARGWWRSDRA